MTDRPQRIAEALEVGPGPRPGLSSARSKALAEILRVQPGDVADDELDELLGRVSPPTVRCGPSMPAIPIDFGRGDRVKRPTP